MRNVGILTTGGALVGLAIGLWLPIRRELGWLRSTLGGTVALGGFALGGELMARMLGKPLGWTVGGITGLPPGVALWMSMIAPPYVQGTCALVGAEVGCFGGAIGGGFLGGMSLYRDIKAGRCKDSTEAIAMSVVMFGMAIIWGGFVLLAVFKAHRALT